MSEKMPVVSLVFKRNNPNVFSVIGRPPIRVSETMKQNSETPEKRETLKQTTLTIQISSFILIV